MIQPHSLVDVAEDIFDEISFELELCPRDAIQLHVRRAFVEFCERTHFWQESVLIDTVPGTTGYAVTLPAGLGLIDIVGVHDQTNDVDLVKSHDECVAYRYWNSSPGHIDIYPGDFTDPLELVVDVAVRPVLSGADFKVSEQLQSDYRTAIVSGAKAALYKIPNKQWTDLQQAQIESSAFHAIANDARLHVANGYSRMPLPSVRKNRLFY